MKISACGKRRRFGTVGAAILLALVAVGGRTSHGAAVQTASYEHAPIDYYKTEVDDPVVRLAERIKSGDVELEYDPSKGYLPALLKELEVPVSSQVLVFAKTSLQLHKIGPERPRAIYFNDRVHVGWCQQGDVIELIAHDAQQGPTFYTLIQSRREKPRMIRDQGQCMGCHANSRTQDVPGYLVRSIFPDVAGRPVAGSASFTTDHTSPFAERWGGWYVTGQHGAMRHMGNVISHGEPPELDREDGANRQSLSELVSLDRYLSPHSDVVALMVLDHQTQMLNALVAGNYTTREALNQSAEMNAALGRDPDELSESTLRRIDRAAERIVERLLFCDEFLLESPVAGSSNFAAEFAARGPQDDQGRSLRQFDLEKRLFRFPCSYLIYSEAFRGLPNEIRSRVVERLRKVLASDQSEAGFEHLSAEDRTAIREILSATTDWF